MLKLMMRISSLVNEKQRLKAVTKRNEDPPLPQMEESVEDDSDDDDDDKSDENISAGLLEVMSPQSKSKVLKKLAVEGKLTPVKRSVRSTSGYQVRISKHQTQESSGIEQAVVNFMNDDENSSVCPDKKHLNIRYRYDYLQVLHDKFRRETELNCSYTTFT